MTRREFDIPATKIYQSLFNLPASPTRSVGQSLKDTLRWTYFREDESEAFWRENIGFAADTYSHMRVFYALGVNFVEAEGNFFTPNEARMFLLGVLCHDFGEGEIGGDHQGDIAWFSKDSSHEEKEQFIARAIISALDIDEDLKDEMVAAYNAVVVGEDKKLNQAFRALEVTEYVITALKIFQKAKEENITFLFFRIMII